MQQWSCGRKLEKIPSEKHFQNTGEDWLQILLSSVPKDVRVKILLLLWRCWHLRENCIHGDGKEPVLVSAAYLSKMHDEWKNVGVAGQVLAGKDSGSQAKSCPSIHTTRRYQWTTQPRGISKLNTDASCIPKPKQWGGGAGARRVPRLAELHDGQHEARLQETYVQPREGISLSAVLRRC